MRKRLIALGLIMVLSLSSLELAGASELSKAKSQKSQAQSNLSSVNDQISEIEQQQASLQLEIDKVDADLVQVLIDLDVIAEEIEEKKVELKQAQTDLEAAKAKEAAQYDAMKTRIRYMYENGNSTFFTALIEADSFADVLNRVEFASKVYDADRTMLIEYQNTKVEVENLVTKVQEEEAELEENQATYQEEQQRLESMKAEKSSQMADFESRLAEAQSLASQYKATIAAQNEIIEQELAAREAESVSNVTAGATSKKSSSGKSSSSNSSSKKSSSDKSSSKSYKSPGGSSGQAIVDYACQFVGNPYVYGGNSLTGGIDCSHFVYQVLKNCGAYSGGYLTSSGWRSAGEGVSVSDMQPGDVVCYSGHVAIYIGGGSIVHASSPSTGIKISGNVHYKTILAVRRFT